MFAAFSHWFAGAGRFAETLGQLLFNDIGAQLFEDSGSPLYTD